MQQPALAEAGITTQHLININNSSMQKRVNRWLNVEKLASKSK
jgi:hypothetical protein